MSERRKETESQIEASLYEFTKETGAIVDSLTFDKKVKLETWDKVFSVPSSEIKKKRVKLERKIGDLLRTLQRSNRHGIAEVAFRKIDVAENAKNPPRLLRYTLGIRFTPDSDIGA